MKPLDLANRRVDGGFFVHNGRNPQPYRWPEADGSNYEIVGTYKESGAPVRDCLVKMIREAENRIFVASFMLGDESVIKELLLAAERLKGGVYVITALDERSLRRGLQEYDETEEAPEERRKNFARLTSGGIYVRGHEECHAKFAVADRSVAIVGSANFVTNGFEWTGELNVVVRDPAQVNRVRAFFTQLWYEGCSWEVPPGPVYTVSQRQLTQSPVRPDSCDQTGNRFVWTNGSENISLLQAIRHVTDGSTGELLLSTFSIVGMTQHPTLILEHLSRAVSRGVGVRLLIRQRNAWPEQMKELLALHDLGIEIYGDLRNHAKAVVADRRLGVVFSANFDAAHGLNSGVEAGVLLNEPGTVGQISQYIDHAIANADTEFVRNPTHAELDGRLAARWCSPWPGKCKLSIQGPEEVSRAFDREVSTGPVLFEQTEDGGLTLFAGRSGLSIEQSTAESYRTDRGLLPQNLTTCERLTNWLTSVRRRTENGQKVMRGFCPAVIHWNP